jgi:trimeric autotransporter adhesin
VYYRLKQTTATGKFVYSRIVALSINGKNIVLLYPNPVKDEASLVISVNKAQQLQCRIIDNAGKLIKQLQWKLAIGSTSLPVDVSNLSAGTYYLELKGETIHEVKRFVKQ